MLVTAELATPEDEVRHAIDVAWEKAMYADSRGEPISVWEALDESLSAKAGPLPAFERRDHTTRPAVPPELSKKRDFPTASEIALLRASKACTEEQLNEWLSNMHDESFNPDDVQWKTARQVKTFVDRVSTNLLRMGVKHHTFKYKGALSPPLVLYEGSVLYDNHA